MMNKLKNLLDDPITWGSLILAVLLALFIV